ncbi:hypothetical protein GIW70_20460 [Pseudomonas syringae]|nr:hypothetical protein [Pseudomonas syringae]MCF5070559.1 hypothetical protein [Pseudomonas syringae]
MDFFTALRPSTSGYTTLQSVAATAQTESGTSATSQQTQSTASSSGDTASISRTASNYSTTSAYYAKFFPSREGMSSDAILNGILHPGNSTSSQGKTFPDVAIDARQRMDDKYAQMTSGEPYDSSNLKDVYSLMGDLDRRSLYAVSSNEGGLFTDEEQQAASFIMNQQQSLATGIYSGIAELEKDFVDPFGTDLLGRIKAGLDFLTSASPEEKQSSYWQNQRATLVRALTDEAQAPGTDGTADTGKSDRHMILAELLAQWSSGSAEASEKSENKSKNTDASVQAIYDKITGQDSTTPATAQ